MPSSLRNAVQHACITSLKPVVDRCNWEASPVGIPTYICTVSWKSYRDLVAAMFRLAPVGRKSISRHMRSVVPGDGNQHCLRSLRQDATDGPNGGLFFDVVELGCSFPGLRNLLTVIMMLLLPC